MNKKIILIASISAGVLLIGGGVTTFVLVSNSSKNVAPAPEPEPPEFTITLNHTILSLKEGEQETLVATTSEAATITWASLDETIATVTQEGLVSALKEGTTTVTASANNKSASCTINVTKDEPPVFTITLNEERIDLKEDEDFTLVATTSEPATVVWASNDEQIATVDQNGHVVAMKEGNTYISATANEKTAYCEVYVTKEVVPPDPDTPITLRWGTHNLTNIDDLQNGEEKGPYQLNLVTSSTSSDSFTGRFSIELAGPAISGEYKLLDYIYIRVYESTTKENALIDINSSVAQKSQYTDITMAGNATKTLYVYIGMDEIPPYIYNELQYDYVNIIFDWNPIL